MLQRRQPRRLEYYPYLNSITFPLRVTTLPLNQQHYVLESPTIKQRKGQIRSYVIGKCYGQIYFTTFEKPVRASYRSQIYIYWSLLPE
jgi:hypothetical protein